MARILLVDDDEAVRLSVAHVLSRDGHGITTAQNGRQALSRAREDDFDLIVTDIVMPDMEGLETIAALRAQSHTVPILAMSGGGRYGSTEHYLACATQFGADFTLRKPFSANLLRAIVDHLIQRGIAPLMRQ
jgi:DNA-binding response OmpR family regulator